MKKSFLTAFVLFGLIFTGCSSADKTHDRPEPLYQEAQEFEKAERYEEAIKRYTELKNRFPYSN